WQGYVYVRDLQTQTTTLLDIGVNGQAANGVASGAYAFSPDSSMLAFTDSATNLTSAPPSTLAPPSGFNGAYQTLDNIYVHDLAAGTTRAVSITPDGALSQGDNSSYAGPSALVFSPDSTKLAFASSAADLVTDQQDNSPGSSGGPGVASNV